MTTTASGLGFVGGGDGNLRAFDAKSGTVLWKFQTGRQIAAGPTVYSVERHRVRRDHGRRDGHLVERGHGREPAAGLLARRQFDPVSGLHDRVPGAHDGPAARRGERRERRARRACDRERSRQDRHPGRADGAAVGSGHVEHHGRPGPPAARRPARRGCEGERRRLGRPADRQERCVRLPGGRHRAGAARRLRGGRGPREDRREAAHRRAARGRAEGAGRDQRRLRDHQPLEPSGRGGDGRGHGSARQRQGLRAAARRSLQLRADGEDHRRERRAGQGRRRDDTNERPQVLDDLRADRSQRRLHLVPGRGGPGGQTTRSR